jgi:hypothetical protein
VIDDVTEEYDVPLMPTGGYVSESFCFNTIEAHGNDTRPLYVYYLGDFDRSGQDAARTTQEKLTRFASGKGIEVHFALIAVTLDQISQLKLPTRPPKRKSGADKNWRYDFACEVDAIPPDSMRELVRKAIEMHMPADRLARLKVQEEQEREVFWGFYDNWRGRE